MESEYVLEKQKAEAEGGPGQEGILSSVLKRLLIRLFLFPHLIKKKKFWIWWCTALFDPSI